MVILNEHKKIYYISFQRKLSTGSTSAMDTTGGGDVPIKKEKKKKKKKTHDTDEAEVPTLEEGAEVVSICIDLN